MSKCSDKKGEKNGKRYIKEEKAVTQKNLQLNIFRSTILLHIKKGMNLSA